MFRRSFRFFDSEKTANIINITNTDLYTSQKGYGFLTEENRKNEEVLEVGDLNSKIGPEYWFANRNIIKIEEDNDGCFVNSDGIIAELEKECGEPFPGEQRFIPLEFKVDVPKQGNYQVTLEIEAPEDMENVTIFTGRRHLEYKGRIPKGNFKLTMLVNVCDIIPDWKTRVYVGKAVNVTVLGSVARMTSLTITDVNAPTLFLMGDSTVTDQGAAYPYAPSSSYGGWGQALSYYLNGKFAVSNHAHSGLTTEAFRAQGHLSIVEQYAKAGDFYFMQFGHNDQKLEHLKANGGYRENLVRFINECRIKGAYPVLVTPIARNTWHKDDTYNDMLFDFADAVIQVGAEMNVPVLDLHKRLMDFVLEHGREDAFRWFFPGDYTHTNDYGAYMVAGFVAAEIKLKCNESFGAPYKRLADAMCDRPELIPPAKVAKTVKPAFYKDIEDPKAGGKPMNVDDLADVVNKARYGDVNNNGTDFSDRK